MKRLLVCLVLVVAATTLSGCYYDPGYSYVRSTGYSGDVYYGNGYYAAPGYSPYYYPYYGYYGPGYGYYGCCSLGFYGGFYGGAGYWRGGRWYGGRGYYRGGGHGGQGHPASSSHSSTGHH
jgi:hypothetical protein